MINRDLSNNCLNMSEIKYKSEFVNIDGSEEQGHCVDKMCSSEERMRGCLLCSGNECYTCQEGRALFLDGCVECDNKDECPFNNSERVYCVEGNTDECNMSDIYGCHDNVCVTKSCMNGVIGGENECGLGGNGCRGC